MEENGARGGSGEEHPRKTGFNISLGNRYLLIAIALVILALNIYLRMGLLGNQGLFEPDGFFYYTAIKETIANHFIEPAKVALSGFPPYNNGINEAQGLIYVAIVPYYFLRFFGISIYTVMRWIPIVFGVLYAILSYFIAKYMTKSRFFGLAAMFFVSISSGNIARTAGTVFRGDSFVPLTLLVALLLMLMALTSERKGRRRYYYMLASVVVLSFGPIIWNGWPFTAAVYETALLMFIAYGFLIADNKLLYDVAILSGMLIVTFILITAYVALGMARPLYLFEGANFFVTYIPLILISVIAFHLTNNLDSIKALSSMKNRAIALVLALIVVATVVDGAFGTYVNSAFGATLSGNSIGATTQELQPVTPQFLFASFSYQLILAPLGIVLFLFFSKLDDEGEKRKKLSLNINYGFLAVMAYLLITAYLQATAIRFNSLVSIPIAIFAGYALYKVLDLSYRKHFVIMFASLIYIVAATFIIVFFYLLPGGAGPWAPFVMAASLALCFVAFALYRIAEFDYRLIVAFAAVFMIIVLSYAIYIAYIQSITSGQADGINPYFLQAMTWLSNNTQTNATVLALWPDGSVVEGWGNRASYMDSVGGENGTRITRFAQWLANITPDSQYLYNIGKPNYFIVRNYWFDELGGALMEGNLQNISDYGTVTLTGGTRSTNPSSNSLYYNFNNAYCDPYANPPQICTAELVTGPVNGTETASAFVGFGTSRTLYKITRVLFYNTSNGAASWVNASSGNTLNYTMMLSYSPSGLSGASILGSKLPESNVFKFLLECTATQCPWNNNGATLQLVYQNPDTKIFKINYI